MRFYSKRAPAVTKLLPFILAGLALAGSPGPATLSLAATGAAFGARRGFGYMIGVIIGMIAVMAIVASGLMALLLSVRGATPVVTALAAAYFVYLAGRIATAPPLSDETTARRQPAFAGGFFLSLVNPKGYVAMAALFSGFVLVRERPGLDALAKLIALTLLITAVNTAWLFAGAGLTRFLRDPRANRAINIAFALVLLASAALALAF